MSATAEAQIKRVDYVDIAQKPENGVFEMGLVLAGAVSAGAYTAGVLDFLIEALDAWEAAKRKCAQQDPDPSRWPIPGHKVRIRVVSGASAGAMNAVIAAIALRYAFTHVRDQASGLMSPFYRPWVRDVDISKLLATGDLASAGAAVVSALDSTSLEQILMGVLDFKGGFPPPRPYLDQSVRFILTQGNLRGIPYFLAMRGNTLDGLGMVAHSDYQSFCVPYGLLTDALARPDDIILRSNNRSSDSHWRAFGDAALASGAFPIGLAPRMIVRNTSDFNYRYAVVPADDTGQAEVVTLCPQWRDGCLTSNPYRTFVVDGGTMDNEPLELARRELAGRLGRNPRAGNRACRATILIDPFPDVAGAMDDPNRGQQDDVLHAGIALMGAWKDQARFDPVDLALAGDESSYSRFLISPDRGGSTRSPESHGFALACGALGGFSGFLSERYRHHDYMLGRRNCQQFLRQHFCLPVDNAPVFGAINPALKALGSRWIAPGGGAAALPIIPLMPADIAAGPDLTIKEPLPKWPRGVFQPESLRGTVGARVTDITDHVLRNSVHLGWFFRWVAKLGLMKVRHAAVDKIVDMIHQHLGNRGLL